jgi:hypothetical protein
MKEVDDEDHILRYREHHAFSKSFCGTLSIHLHIPLRTLVVLVPNILFISLACFSGRLQKKKTGFAAS